MERELSFNAMLLSEEWLERLRSRCRDEAQLLRERGEEERRIGPVCACDGECVVRTPAIKPNKAE